MDSSEIQARATIAAALIVSRAVEVPTIPGGGQPMQSAGIVRLRDLTEYIYQTITAPPGPIRDQS